VVTDAILDWIFDFVEWMISGFPSLNLPSNVLDFAWISDVNYFLPISEMFTLFSAFFLLGGPMAATSLIIWFFVGIVRGGATKA